MADPRKDGKTRKLQQIDRRNSVVTKYTEYVENFSNNDGSRLWGTEGVEIVPGDANSVTVREYDIASNQAARVAVVRSYADVMSLRIPPVLVDLTAVYNSNSGAGSDTHTALGFSAGDTWSFGVNLPGSATSSASLISDVIPVLREFYADTVDVTTYVLNVVGSYTRASLLTALTAAAGSTVNAWPAFKPETFSIICTGAQASVRADVNAAQSVSASDSNTTFTQNQGLGNSVETGASTKNVIIPSCLHPDITISNASASVVITATATAGWNNSPDDPNFPDLVVTTTTPSQTVASLITPSFLPATSPVGVPLSGLYLYKIERQPADDDISEVNCTVVDMSFFGPSLSALAVSHGSLAPVFSASAERYRVNVGTNTSMTVTPTRQGSTATIKVNGTTVTSGSASGSISLSVGENTILIILTEGVNTTTYMLTVTRTA